MGTSTYASSTPHRSRRTPSARRRRTTAGLALFIAAAFVAGSTFGAASTASFAAIPVDSTTSGVVNTYQKVSDVTGTTVTVTGATRGAATPFAVGDRVMLIQMTGLPPVITGSNMGNYDVTMITAISGDQITLANVARTYSPATEAVQLVRTHVDALTTTVAGTVTAAPWDGSTGGVISMRGTTLQLNANIDATGTGFTELNAPTADVTGFLSTGSDGNSGLGSLVGRGQPGVDQTNTDASVPGGGIGGGGGASLMTDAGGGGGVGGAAQQGNGGSVLGLNPVVSTPGLDGGVATAKDDGLGTANAVGGAGGGGGITGGGGGGGAGAGAFNLGNPSAGGAGGGTNGGGAGGYVAADPSYGEYVGGGGGGVGGVGNGGDGVIGYPIVDAVLQTGEGSGGGGGGSYGGGGGGSSNMSGGDDSVGGGGGGSWTGGGAGAPMVGGGNTLPAGGNGNAPVATPIPDAAHYLNVTNPRLMMGGAGGKGSQDSGFSEGGAGGGIVFLDYETIAGTGAIISDGAQGLEPAGGGGHSGSGGGGGGQMRIRATEVTAPSLTLQARGGVGGAPGQSTDLSDGHAGVPGGGGGGGGVWLELANATQACPSADLTSPVVDFDTSGGATGPSKVNPKNGLQANISGSGGNGLSCISPIAPLVEPLVSVGSVVWFDANRDGRQDADEAPVAGVVVNLYDARGILITTTTTDSTGFYSFTGLTPGFPYSIEFVKPTGQTFTTRNSGEAAKDSNPDVVTGLAPFTAPAAGANSATTPDDPTINAGLIPAEDPGNEDPGNEDPGNPGNEDPGNEDPGNEDPGNPGNEDPGNPGNEDPGNEDPGNGLAQTGVEVWPVAVVSAVLILGGWLLVRRRAVSE